jgi:putative transposase
MNYTTDVNDSQWKIIKKFLDTKRKRQHDLRRIWNAIQYILKTGCQWRMLPKNFAPWSVVYYYYRRWKYAGVMELMLEEVTYRIRKAMGKKGQPTACVIDSQSIKTTSVGGFCLGYDAGKKTKGRKRHIAVDTMGNLLTVDVHSASLNDRDMGCEVLSKAKEKYPALAISFADGGYSGRLEQTVQNKLNIGLKIVKKIRDGFHVLPKRWIVERTFAWINNDRRNAKDYEYSPLTSETMIQLSMIRLGLNRIFK